MGRPPTDILNVSYCRWSSDDFQCDVYVYASDRGWTTHVAGRRHVFSAPLPPPLDYAASPEAWWERHQIVSDMVDKADLVDIGGEYDGATFDDDTPGECADTLERLRACGYIVPQYAIDELREEEEAADEATPLPRDP